MCEEDLNTYKKYVSDLDITKYIVLDSESNYWYSTEYVDKMLKKQDKEIERLNNIINEFEILIKHEITESIFEDNYGRVDSLEYCLATLRELKGSDKR